MDLGPWDVIVECGGGEHTFRIGRDGTLTTLDHNLKTLKAFAAFDADKPACLMIVEAMQPPLSFVTKHWEPELFAEIEDISSFYKALRPEVMARGEAQFMVVNALTRAILGLADRNPIYLEDAVAMARDAAKMGDKRWKNLDYTFLTLFKLGEDPAWAPLGRNIYARRYRWSF